MGTSVLGKAVFAIVGGTGAYHQRQGLVRRNPAAARARRQRTAEFDLTLSS